MNPLILNKLERLKEEVKYLTDNKKVFQNNLKTSIETKKIAERSVYLIIKKARFQSLNVF